jgi:hypothetical protein
LLREAGFQWNGQCSQLEDDFIWKLNSFINRAKTFFWATLQEKSLEVLGVFDGLSQSLGI